MRLGLVLVVAVLAGCGEKPVEEMGYAEISALAAEIDARCTALGLPPGSAQHKQCGQVEAQKEITTRRANLARRNNAAIAMGEGMQSMSQGYYNAAAANAANRPINCTTQRFGTITNTHCN